MAITLINSFVISRVDCCNSVIVGLPAYQANRIPAVLNDAARQILGGSRHDHVTPILRDRLHWLRAPQRIEFKVALLVYKTFNNLAPDNIASYTFNQVAPTNFDSHFGLQTRASSSCLRLWPSLTNNHLLLPHLICGTICQLMFDNHYRSTYLREVLKHFCSISFVGTIIM